MGIQEIRNTFCLSVHSWIFGLILVTMSFFSVIPTPNIVLCTFELANSESKVAKSYLC